MKRRVQLAPVSANPGASPGQEMRFKGLDALRGIAAVIVVFYHLKMAFAVSHKGTLFFDLLLGSPARVLVSGRGAVLLFFVLSGFVLSLSFRRPQPYLCFILRRFIRIYVPFAAAIGLSAILYSLVKPEPVPVLGPWFNEKSWTALSPAIVARHLLMTGADMQLNRPMWTLIHELRISLIFPLLFYICRKGGGWSAAIMLALYGGLWWQLRVLNIFPYAEQEQSFLQSLLITAYFIPFFMAGILLCLHREKVVSWLNRFKKEWVVLGLIGWGCFLTDYDALLGSGAVLTIALTMPQVGFLARLLRRRFFLWLGRISYSLYLVHLPLILTVTHLLYGRMSLPFVLSVILICVFAAAEIFYRLIEAPAISLSRQTMRTASN